MPDDDQQTPTPPAPTPSCKASPRSRPPSISPSERRQDSRASSNPARALSQRCEASRAPSDDRGRLRAPACSAFTASILGQRQCDMRSPDDNKIREHENRAARLQRLADEAKEDLDLNHHPGSTAPNKGKDSELEIQHYNPIPMLRPYHPPPPRFGTPSRSHSSPYTPDPWMSSFLLSSDPRSHCGDPRTVGFPTIPWTASHPVTHLASCTGVFPPAPHLSRPIALTPTPLEVCNQSPDLDEAMIPGLTASSLHLPMPDHAVDVMKGRWVFHLSLVFLTNLACRIASSNRVLDAGSARDGRKSLSLSAVDANTAKCAETDLTFVEWTRAWDRMLILIDTYKPALWARWEAHCKLVYGQDDIHDHRDLWLRYDIQMRMITRMQRNVDTTIINHNILNQVQRELVFELAASHPQ
ncbi:Reverse transcriptase domain protein [Ceratobasidium sp. AG-Ba]|nr:Reverse transcriptase domain protein [Ceratobasidium sp. AG-Ba]